MTLQPPNTHVFESKGALDLKLDVYTPDESIRSGITLLYFHAGGLVDGNRELIPPHIVQAALRRGWILASADYRLLPQAHGSDLLEDAVDAQSYLRAIGLGENLIVCGSSAGAYMAFLAGHYFTPKPLAVLNYYGIPSFRHDFFYSGHVFGDEPMKQTDIQHFLDESITTGQTLSADRFNPQSLMADLTQNKEYSKPEVEKRPGLERGYLYDWLVQETEYPVLVGDIDKPLDSKIWHDFPPLISVHGDADVDVPIQFSQDVTAVVDKAELFIASGKPHNFDVGLYLGDAELETIELAWTALEKIAAERIGPLSQC